MCHRSWPIGTPDCTFWVSKHRCRLVGICSGRFCLRRWRTGSDSKHGSPCDCILGVAAYPGSWVWWLRTWACLCSSHSAALGIWAVCSSCRRDSIGLQTCKSPRTWLAGRPLPSWSQRRAGPGSCFDEGLSLRCRRLLSLSCSQLLEADWHLSLLLAQRFFRLWCWRLRIDWVSILWLDRQQSRWRCRSWIRSGWPELRGGGSWMWFACWFYSR